MVLATKTEVGGSLKPVKPTVWVTERQCLKKKKKNEINFEIAKLNAILKKSNRLYSSAAENKTEGHGS